MPTTMKPIETIEEYEDAKKRLPTLSGDEKQALSAAVEKWEMDHAEMPKAIKSVGN